MQERHVEVVSDSKAHVKDPMGIYNMMINAYQRNIDINNDLESSDELEEQSALDLLINASIGLLDQQEDETKYDEYRESSKLDIVVIPLSEEALNLEYISEENTGINIFNNADYIIGSVVTTYKSQLYGNDDRKSRYEGEHLKSRDYEKTDKIKSITAGSDIYDYYSFREIDELIPILESHQLFAYQSIQENELFIIGDEFRIDIHFGDTPVDPDTISFEDTVRYSANQRSQDIDITLHDQYGEKLRLADQEKFFRALNYFKKVYPVLLTSIQEEQGFEGLRSPIIFRPGADMKPSVMIVDKKTFNSDQTIEDDEDDQLNVYIHHPDKIYQSLQQLKQKAQGILKDTQENNPEDVEILKSRVNVKNILSETKLDEEVDGVISFEVTHLETSLIPEDRTYSIVSRLMPPFRKGLTLSQQDQIFRGKLNDLKEYGINPDHQTTLLLIEELPYISLAELAENLDSNKLTVAYDSEDTLVLLDKNFRVDITFMEGVLDSDYSPYVEIQLKAVEGKPLCIDDQEQFREALLFYRNAYRKIIRSLYEVRNILPPQRQIIFSVDKK